MKNFKVLFIESKSSLQTAYILHMYNESNKYRREY